MVNPANPSPQWLTTAAPIDIIVGPDASGQPGVYYTDPSRAVANSITTLQPGRAYFLHATSAAAPVITGQAVSGSLQQNLAAGWNWIGWQGATAQPPATAFAGLDESWDAIIGFDAATGQSRAYFIDPAKAILNSLDQVEPGKGYWLHATQAVTWTYMP